jgi:hypothetical protein
VTKFLLPALLLGLSLLSSPTRAQDGWSQPIPGIVNTSVDAGLISVHRSAAASQVEQARAGLRGGSPLAQAAMLRWYKVQPGTVAYETTKTKVLANLDRIYTLLLASTFPVVRAAEGHCGAAGVWGCADIGNTTKGVRLQNLWFQSAGLCRNSVLVHETGHTIGLTHTPAGCGGPDCKATSAMTNAESLGNANSIAQFVEQIAYGTYDSCEAGR